MALGPSKSNITEGDTTKKNIDVWNNISNNIVDKPAPPKPPKCVLKSENSLEPIPGSTIYSAKDALNDSTKVNDIYDKDKLSDIVDSCIDHIKSEAQSGEMWTGIDLSPFNDGLRNAFIKEMKRRGFKVSKEPKSQHGYIVDWSPNKWLLPVSISAALILFVLLIWAGIEYKSHQNVKQIQNVEQTK